MYLKPLSQMKSDVKEGDLIKVFLERSTYVGYKWGDGKGTVYLEKGQRILRYEKESFLLNASDSLLDRNEADIILCGLNPYGYTNNTALDKIPLVGINLEKETMGGMDVKGYQVIERNRHRE
jgi:hypothetical protein